MVPDIEVDLCQCVFVLIFIHRWPSLEGEAIIDDSIWIWKKLCWKTYRLDADGEF